MRIHWIEIITSIGIVSGRGMRRRSRGRIRRRIIEIQNRGEDFSGARSNETRGRDNETRDPIRARRLRRRRRRRGAVVGGATPCGCAPARADNFAGGSRSGNGSHRSTWESASVFVAEFKFSVPKTPLNFTLLFLFPRNRRRVWLL